MNHEAVITATWHDCGAVIHTVACSCGYTGQDAAGWGCWQVGHNVPHELDSIHNALVVWAYLPATPGTLQGWQSGPAQPERTLTLSRNA